MTVFKKSNIPNFLSVFRIMLVPVFVYLFMFAKLQGTAILVFLLAGATDVVDGILARKNNWISNVGKILDPFADKCMQIAALVCLMLSKLIPAWLATVLCLKEFLLLVGATTALKSRKVYVQSDWYGKAGTVAFYIIATLFVLAPDIPDTVKLILEVLLIAFMLFALVMYSINYKKNIITKKKVSQMQENN
ncbi:MAG: CDP-alcohol phosphatidyltransferase family protein [Ruminococcaceae bacterium]|nr:CDP-alcohol phosphatidyltransferase family protein [Oscillospiraceae bacterium]